MLDPLKRKLLDQAKAELGQVLGYVLRTKGESFTAADLDAAFVTLASRGHFNLGGDWPALESVADCRDPGDFRAQAPVVDALLRTASQTPNQKP